MTYHISHVINNYAKPATIGCASQLMLGQYCMFFSTLYGFAMALVSSLFVSFMKNIQTKMKSPVFIMTITKDRTSPFKLSSSPKLPHQTKTFEHIKLLPKSISTYLRKLMMKLAIVH